MTKGGLRIARRSSTGHRRGYACTRFRALGAALLVLLLAPPRAEATPVEVGRYTALAYGRDPAQVHAAEGGAVGRRGQSAHPAPVRGLVRRFELALPVGRAFEPVVDADGRVFVAGRQGVCGVDSAGRVLFHHNLGAASGSPALAPDGSVVVATREAGLWFLTPEGRVRHKVVLEGIRGAPLVLDDGSVIVSLASWHVVRVDSAGVVRFELPLRRGMQKGRPGADDAAVRDALADLEPLAGPARGEQGPVVFGAGRDLWFVHPEGLQQRHHHLAAPSVVPPVLDERGRAWVFCADRVIRRLDADGGVLEVSVSQMIAAQGRLAMTDEGVLRVPMAGGVIIAVSREGEVLPWASTSDALPQGGVLDTASRYVFVDGAGQLLVFGASGHMKLKMPTGTRGARPPVLLTAGRLLLVTLDDSLQLWGPP